jgi:hypothetical protein
VADTRSIYGMSPTRCFILLIFTIPAVLLCLLTAVELAREQQPIVGALFFATDLALAVWITFMVTSRLEVSSGVLTRSWLLGSSCIAISEITQLRWSGARGQTFLTIRTPKTWFVLSSATYGNTALHEIEGLLRQAGVPAA